jgi:hypothetical protein
LFLSIQCYADTLCTFLSSRHTGRTFDPVPTQPKPENFLHGHLRSYSLSTRHVTRTGHIYFRSPTFLPHRAAHSDRTTLMEHSPPYKLFACVRSSHDIQALCSLRRFSTCESSLSRGGGMYLELHWRALKRRWSLSFLYRQLRLVLHLRPRLLKCRPRRRVSRKPAPRREKRSSSQRSRRLSRPRWRCTFLYLASCTVRTRDKRTHVNLV